VDNAIAIVGSVAPSEIFLRIYRVRKKKMRLKKTSLDAPIKKIM
jgi:hypothetical protein